MNGLKYSASYAVVENTAGPDHRILFITDEREFENEYPSWLRERDDYKPYIHEHWLVVWSLNEGGGLNGY